MLTKNITSLCLLDLFAASDITYHNILISHLWSWLSSNWFKSVLSSRCFRVKMATIPLPVKVVCAVFLKVLFLIRCLKSQICALRTSVKYHNVNNYHYKNQKRCSPTKYTKKLAVIQYIYNTQYINFSNKVMLPLR